MTIAYRARLDRSNSLPRLGTRAFLEPPREAELRWINDRSIPLNARLVEAMKLFDASKAIMKRYVARDVANAVADPAHASGSPETLVWSASVVRLFGRISEAAVDEFAPSLSPTDAGYATRMQALEKVRVDAATMLRGALITLGARRSGIAYRRRLADAWRDQAHRYAALWRPAQCRRLHTWVEQVLAGERDATVRDDLKELANSLAACHGGGPASGTAAKR